MKDTITVTPRQAWLLTDAAAQDGNHPASPLYWARWRTIVEDHFRSRRSADRTASWRRRAGCRRTKRTARGPR